MREVSRRIVAVVLVLVLPTVASAGSTGTATDGERPIAAAVERSGREIVAAQQAASRSRSRFWTGLALIAGGGVLTALGIAEVGDDETGPDDGEDNDGSDDGEDKDGWGNKAMLGGGIAAAAFGTVLLMTGRKNVPAVAVKRGAIAVQHTITF